MHVCWVLNTLYPTETLSFKITDTITGKKNINNLPYIEGIDISDWGINCPESCSKMIADNRYAVRKAGTKVPM